MKTIDEQLEEALARVKQLESDATASAALLTEAGHQHDRFRQEVAALTKERDALAAADSAAQLGKAQEQIAALTGEKETLALTNGELTEQRDQLSRDLATAKQSLTTAANAAEELAKAKEQLAALTAEIEKLKKLCKQRSEAAKQNDEDTVNRADIEFHQTIIAASANNIIRDMVRQTHLFDRIFHIAYAVPAYWPEDETLPYGHLHIIDALEKRDADLAENLVKRHIQSAKKRRIESLIGKLDVFEKS